MYVYSFTGILELDNSDECRTNTRTSTDLQQWCSKWLFQVVVPSVELEKLAYREESVATAWM